MSQTARISDLSSIVDAELSDIVNNRKVPLYDMMAYHMGWVGDGVTRHVPSFKERRHGVACLLVNSAVGGDVKQAVPAAAAIELVHNFTLIHDDVQGGNPKRDNRDAVWWVWGPAQAINAGDGMHALARLALFRLLDKGVSAETTFKAVQVMDEYSLLACEGRFMDLEAQERIDVMVNGYLKMAEAKTGSLFACAMRLGALVASRDDDVQNAFGVCGSKLGVALQIRSDLRDIWPEVVEVDSPSIEVMNKKKLLPVVYAFENAEVKDKRRLGEVYFKRVLDPEDVGRLRGILEEMDVKRDCERLANTYRSEAVAALDVQGISDEGRSEIEQYISTMLGESA